VTTTHGEPRFAGPQGPGAMREYRKQKRADAEHRNHYTWPERRRAARQLAAMDDEMRAAIAAARTGLAKTARAFGVSPQAVEAIWAEGRTEA
jgi:hypothetical protein